MKFVNYPDGSTLATTALTIFPNGGTFGPILQLQTLSMMGLNPPGTPQQALTNSDRVRLEWATQGQPFGNSDEDVCYVRVTPKDEWYDKIREVTATGNPSGDNTFLQEQWNYTNVWTVRWIFYGPNAVDFARQVRSALQQEFFILQFQQFNLFPVCDIPTPMRVPDQTAEGLWLERCDIECDFYEFVTETILRQTVKSVEVIVQNPSGVIADITVTGS